MKTGWKRKEGCSLAPRKGLIGIAPHVIIENEKTEVSFSEFSSKLLTSLSRQCIKYLLILSQNSGFMC